MSDDSSRRDQLLAVALGSTRHGQERRTRPDRRSGIERRKLVLEVAVERRVGDERRQNLRREGDRAEGATLLGKARARLRRAPASPGLS